MKSHKSLLLSAVVAALVFPVAAYAQDASKGMTGTMNHGGELGVVDHNPPKSTKSRAQVKKELETAHKDGSHEHGSEVSTLKPEPTASRPRATVKAELAAMTPEEKKKLKESNLGGK